MRQYLLYSSYTHFALLVCVMFVARSSFSIKKSEPYYIDFIGGSKIITMETATLKEKAQKNASSTREKDKAADTEDFSSSKALRKPSVLNGSEKLFEEAIKPVPEAETGSMLVTDTSNFPYPWYITQVREALWNAWSTKMPSGGALKCTIKFDILRDGTIKSIATEKSSGNRLFDSAAQSSVESADPFPSLPEDFHEESLSVHVEFKAMR